MLFLKPRIENIVCPVYINTAATAAARSISRLSWQPRAVRWLMTGAWNLMAAEWEKILETAWTKEKRGKKIYL